MSEDMQFILTIKYLDSEPDTFYSSYDTESPSYPILDTLDEDTRTQLHEFLIDRAISIIHKTAGYLGYYCEHHPETFLDNFSYYKSRQMTRFCYGYDGYPEGKVRFAFRSAKTVKKREAYFNVIVNVMPEDLAPSSNPPADAAEEDPAPPQPVA